LLISEILTIISLLFTIPVLVVSYYYVLELVCALRYPRSLELSKTDPKETPLVSILIATYNEKFVIGRTVDAIKSSEYSRDKLQIIIADDSDDETSRIIDQKAQELRSLGFETEISRRNTRANFKSGALHQASHFLKGDYVLLLDADSAVQSDVLLKGLGAFNSHPGLSFVSYRVGHYNRQQNLTTRLFALSLDLGDALGKMGAYMLNLPFSLQGGFALVSRKALEQAGYWSTETIVEDADLSCRMYESGRRGIYLSNERIFSEDPSSLGVWKKQAARVSQGWAKCITTHFKTIISTPNLSFGRRIALLLALLAPVASLSWIVVNFISGLSLATGIGTSNSSIFSSPLYVALVTIPGAAILLGAAFALYVQKLMTPRNLILIPLLSYVGLCMLTTNSIGFLNGLFGRTGFFFRTPKKGHQTHHKLEHYSYVPPLDRISIVEGILSIVALILFVFALFQGVWFLAFSLLGFGALTLKSMNLSQLIRSSREKIEESQKSIPIVVSSLE
jgi:cellulose synthase/poly-beta-1,6-N-acetylglucosamine synthase-like glycosyltransferase